VAHPLRCQAPVGLESVGAHRGPLHVDHAAHEGALAQICFSDAFAGLQASAAASLSGPSSRTSPSAPTARARGLPSRAPARCRPARGQGGCAGSCSAAHRDFELRSGQGPITSFRQAGTKRGRKPARVGSPIWLVAVSFSTGFGDWIQNVVVLNLPENINAMAVSPAALPEPRGAGAAFSALAGLVALRARRGLRRPLPPDRERRLDATR